MTGYFQRLGRALMLPLTVLPAAAVFLMLSRLPWEAAGWPVASELLWAAGMSVFHYAPYLFAVGIALGLANQSVYAGLSALAGMFIYMLVTHTYNPDGVQPVMFVAAVIGVLSGWAYERFKTLKLPEYLQFFGGSRFVPILMSLVSLAFAWVMIPVGETVRAWIAAAGDIVYSAGGFGVFLYGFLHRILVAFGMHHVLNHIFWFQIGQYTAPDGSVHFGDMMRFFAGDPAAGIFMAGLYPIMMFALPAIAFAIAAEAREDLQPTTRRQFRAAALTSFMTGVTEPVEFAFLFAAPYLYLVHAALSGGIMWLVYELDIRHGFAFSAGFLEYMVNLHLAKNGLLLLPVGLGVGVVYYVLFRWSTRRFRLTTPGREEAVRLDDWETDLPYHAPLVLQALGGKENIAQLDSCITRLRITVHDERKIDVKALRDLGAAGVIRLGGGHVQVVFGTYSEMIREEILKIMRLDERRVEFVAPVAGRMIPLEEVKDPVFAGKLLGQGVAFVPEKGELAAPVRGRIVHLPPTRHAVGIRTPEGLDVLLHIGIDTVSLDGKGFEALVREGDEVKPGQTLIRFHLPTLRKHAKALDTPMVITNTERVRSWRFAPYKAVKKGQAAVMSVVVKETETRGGET